MVCPNMYFRLLNTWSKEEEHNSNHLKWFPAKWLLAFLISNQSINQSFLNKMQVTITMITIHKKRIDNKNQNMQQDLLTDIHSIYQAGDHSKLPTGSLAMNGSSSNWNRWTMKKCQNAHGQTYMSLDVISSYVKTNNITLKSAQIVQPFLKLSWLYGITSLKYDQKRLFIFSPF